MNDIIDHLHESHGQLLGAPLNMALSCPDGVGRYRHFERGSIHAHPATGAHETHGAIRDAWATTNWEQGWLGYPVTDERPLCIMELYPICDDGETYYPVVGRISYFQRGAIYWLSDSGKIGFRARPSWPSWDPVNYARLWPDA